MKAHFKSPQSEVDHLLFTFLWGGSTGQDDARLLWLVINISKLGVWTLHIPNVPSLYPQPLVSPHSKSASHHPLSVLQIHSSQSLLLTLLHLVLQVTNIYALIWVRFCCRNSKRMMQQRLLLPCDTRPPWCSGIVASQGSQIPQYLL